MRFRIPALVAADALLTLAPEARATDYFVKVGGTGRGTGGRSDGPRPGKCRGNPRALDPLRR